MSQEQEDYDHATIDGVKYRIKPHSLYPDRDAELEKKARGPGGDDDRSHSRTRRK